jgi:hypothetical protein
MLRELRQQTQFGFLEGMAMLDICEIAVGEHARGVSLIAMASSAEGLEG